jgi:tetratricopeptide (TPR) repeat protein
MKRAFHISAVVILSCLAAPLARGQEWFRWSWEKKSKAAAPADTQPAQVQPAAAPAAQAAPTSGVAAAGGPATAYGELLKENLDLRRKISEITQGEEAVKKENTRLTRELKDLEEKMGQFASQIQDLKKKKALLREDPDKAMEMELRLAKAEGEKSRMANEVDELRKRISNLGAPPPSELPPQPKEGVQPGSDLFRQVEAENAFLKDRLASLEGEREQAVKTSGEMTEAKDKSAEERAKMEAELKQSKAKEKQHMEVVKKLLKQIPDMEKELTDLKKQVAQKQLALDAKEKDLDLLKQELEKREDRLTKAEKMTAVLATARKEVWAAHSRDSRDLHYNMAQVYSREGRFKDAEKEYLEALKLDPTDADVHYNLGVLYDDELKNKRQAAVHYRRYLKLRPDAPDVDTVRNWLMRLELGAP